MDIEEKTLEILDLYNTFSMDEKIKFLDSTFDLFSDILKKKTEGMDVVSIEFEFIDEEDGKVFASFDVSVVDKSDPGADEPCYDEMTVDMVELRDESVDKMLGIARAMRS